jgi:hypothetical protein
MQRDDSPSTPEIDNPREISPQPSAKGISDASLKADSILLEEFRYVASTSIQLQNERSSLFNLYLILAGILVSGLSALVTVQATTKLIDTKVLSILAGVGLIAMGLLSFIFFIWLIRLDRNYDEAIVTINRIKEFYIQQFQEQLPLERVLDRHLTTLPVHGRVGSTTFFMSLIVAILGSVYMSATVEPLVYAFLPHLGPETIYSRTYGLIISVPLFIIMLVAYFLSYRSASKR